VAFIAQLIEGGDDYIKFMVDRLTRLPHLCRNGARPGSWSDLSVCDASFAFHQQKY
jgi:hypothetical protein